MRHLWNPYYALFYFLFRFFQGARGETSPQVPAWLFVTVISYCTVLFTVACFEPVTHMRIYTPHLTLLQGIAVVLILSIPHYFLTLYRRRYVKLTSQFDTKPRGEKIFNLCAVLVVAFAPFFLFMLLVHFDIIHRPDPHI